MEFLYNSLQMKAFWFGILSAISLPIGAIIGILVKPPKKVTAAIMAFGAGALLASLTLELIQPAFEHTGFFPIAIGAIIGGSLFYFLNKNLNAIGGFLRKNSTIQHYANFINKITASELIDFLASIEVFRNMPPELIYKITPFLKQHKLPAETVIYEEGKIHNSMYFVKSGKVEVFRDGDKFAELSSGEILGEMKLLSGGGKRTATAKTSEDTVLYELTKDNFNQLENISKEIHKAFYHVAEKRLLNQTREESDENKIAAWKQQVNLALALKNIPSEKLKTVIPYLHTRNFKKDDVIFEEGSVSKSLFFIISGNVSIIKEGDKVAELGEGQILGEMSLFTKKHLRTATVISLNESTLYELEESDFEKISESSHEFLDELYSIANKRLDDEAHKFKKRAHKIDTWKKIAKDKIEHVSRKITIEEINALKGKAKFKNAVFAIWLGILLDGIPESAVIGASMVKTSVSLPLILGLFLANLPEALSSAVGMQKQGYSVTTIMLLWSSLTLLTGAGAFAGNLLFVNASAITFAVFEGCAAGAMLAMISETMLPEAYDHGETVVGMSTLCGFLSVLFVRSLSI